MASMDAHRRFRNHPPRTPEVEKVLDQVTDLMLEAASFIETLPPGRERDLALTRLEECSMWCKAAVARNQ